MIKHSFPVKCTRVTDDYEVTEIALGSGISGKVLRCIKKSTGIKYALKVLEYNALSIREIDLHYRSSECPNVVKIKEIYENSNSSSGRNHLLVIMECMEGGELFNKIQSTKNGFTERDAARIFYQICTAISFLHRRNIAHRDLKPENLLFDSDSPNANLKLTDFGFAKESLPGKNLKSPRFTPYYAAPEIFGPENYDKRCDIWSLGVITYILLCGYPPFYSDGGDPISPGMKNRIRNGQYNFPSNEWDAVSNEAKDLIRKLLIVEPDQRLTIEQVMQHPWVTRYEFAPQTPLATINGLNNERVNWSEVQVSGNDHLTAASTHNFRTEFIESKVVDATATNVDKLQDASEGIDIEGIRMELRTLRTESNAPRLKQVGDSQNPILLRRRVKGAKKATESMDTSESPTF